MMTFFGDSRQYSVSARGTTLKGTASRRMPFMDQGTVM